MMKMDSVDMNMGGGNVELPQETLEMLQNSDVTTIVDTTKVMSTTMFSMMTPPLIEMIQSGMTKGIDGIYAAVASMKEAQSNMNQMPEDMGDMGDVEVMNTMNPQIESMETLSMQMTEMKDAIPGAFDTAKENYLAEIDEIAPQIEESFQKTLNQSFSYIYILTGIISVLALVLLAFYDNKNKNSL